ncbi:glycosyltransferase family 2 protein [Methylotuvimicrobium sp. KM1]|uniref:glycosyltransferase family 2 protein n=1 Tax=Methylotuvimicrobium sp. KM1 TaxID=3377707 RepID=UPI00385038B7
MTSKSISLLLPTRGRPALVERLFNSISKTVSRFENIEVILYTDRDDPSSHGLTSTDFSVTTIIGHAKSMGGYNSACLNRARGNIIILANDDMVMRTLNWDVKIMQMDAEFGDKIYLAYGNDLFKKRSLCTFPILSRRTCELLVEPYPIAYGGAFIDVHLFDIFKRLQYAGFDRIRYMEDVIFEHLHYRVGKADCDDTYTRRGRFADDSIFVAMADSRRQAVGRLLTVLRGEPLPPFEPQMDCRNIPNGLIAAISYFTRQFLLDSGLSIRWRAYLWCWFIGRYLAARGFLKLLMR